jgi:phage tail sheath protein FI
MAEYLSPGVYVEEIDAGPKPIEGVSTSTAGAVGVTERGPSGGGLPGGGLTRGKPELVTSFAEFVRKFGGFLPEPDPGLFNQWALNASEGGRWWQFPLAVKGFFDNGGQRLYVKRVFSSTATPAEATLGQGVIAEVTRDAPATATEVQIRHLLGIQNGTGVNLIAGGSAAGVFTITRYDSTRLTVTLNNPVGRELKAGRDFLEIVPRTAPAVGPPDTRTLSFRAKSVGVWGGNLSSPRPADGIRARVRPMVGATLKLLSDPALGGNPVRTTVTTEASAGDTTISVASVVGLANGDTVEILGNPFTLSNVRGATTTLTAVANAAATAISVASVVGLANGDTVEILGNSFTLNNVNPGNNTFDIAPAVPAGSTWPVGTEVRRLPRTFSITPAVPAGASWPIGTTVRRLATFNVTPPVPLGVTWPVGTNVQRLRPANSIATPGPTINVQGAAQLYQGAMVELDNGTNKEQFTVDLVTGQLVTLSGNVTQAYYEGYRLRVIEAEVQARYERNGVVEVEESFPNLRLTDDGSLSYILNHINIRSTLVDVERLPGFSDSNYTAFPSVHRPAAGGPDRLWIPLDRGNDGYDQLSVDDFVGTDGGSGNRTGIQALEDIDEISVCLAPGIWASTVHNSLIQHCESLKDRFAILDPQDGLSIEGIRTVRETLDTKYAALYYPWIEVRDPSVRRNVYVAPSGHMGGIYARVDVERGVHKAPANEVIRGITKIAQDVTKREQDLLNPKGINALRFFPGRGNRVWGARTVSSDASWKYINVRRLFIFVEESIDEGTQWVVFEPNDEPLWARVRQTITNFLTTVWRSGALEGTKPDDAFFVKCDRTTMTQDDIDNGRLICLIGIAPVKPAEFVIFRIQQKTRESQTA